MDNDKRGFYSDVPISKVVLAPSKEDASMGGFAWSREWGLIPEMVSLGTKKVRPKFKVINWR